MWPNKCVWSKTWTENPSDTLHAAGAAGCPACPYSSRQKHSHRQCFTRQLPLTWILTMPRQDPLHRLHSLSHFLPTEPPQPCSSRRFVGGNKHIQKAHSINCVNRAHVATTPADEWTRICEKAGASSVMCRLSDRLHAIKTAICYTDPLVSAAVDGLVCS